MENLSPEVKKARVKELEQIVKKLERENKQLLSKVRTGSPTLRQPTPEIEPSSDDVLENGLLDLENMNLDSLSDGEWLYVSPKLPLTPAQKKQTPLQWLSEGHDNRLGDIDIPSLDEVKKALVFNMEEAETISKAAHPKPHPNNRTAQKYLNRVRERSRSNSPTMSALENGDDSIPVVSWRPTELSSELEVGNDEVVPVVKWNPEMPEEENEEVPVVKWKKPKIPQEDVPVVRKARMPEEDNESVPVVKWKKPTMPQEENEDVPVVKWKKPTMPQEENEDVPVVKWKKPTMPQEENEDVPVVKWEKPTMPREDNEDVPVVKWKARMPNDNSAVSPGQNRHNNLVRPVIIKRTEAISSNTSSETSESSQTNSEFERRGLRAPHHSGLRQSQGAVSPSQSPTNSQSRLGAGRGLRKPRMASPGQPQSLRSRSPSPSSQTSSGGKRQLVRPTASSPSRRTASPGRSLAHPEGSPAAAKRQVQQPGGSTKHPSGLPTGPKGTSQEGARVSRLQAHQRQSTPPQSSGIRTPGSSGTRGLSPLGAGKKGITPPKGGLAGKPRRTLPTPPSANTNPSRPQPSSAEDDWLEGCF